MVTPLSAVGIMRYHRPAEAYTKIRNDFARSAQISLRAFRVAGYILSHADGFVQTQKQIARACGLSPNTVRAALEDLRRDRYLVSVRVREHGRWTGTAYAVSDIPFTAEEAKALLTPCADSEHSECERSESAPPKKISSRSETTNPEKTHPSGGQTADAAAPSLEVPSPPTDREEPVTQAEPIPLFDVPAPKIKDAGKPKPPRESSAGTVVAKFVDAYRRAHGGADPVKAAIGRVARDAKMLIETGRAAPAELERAATVMGGTSYNNLPVQLDKLREDGKRGGRQPGTPARPHTDPHWQEVEKRQRAEYYNSLLNSDDSIRWARRFPDEVDRLLAEWPELADRFRDVA